MVRYDARLLYKLREYVLASRQSQFFGELFLVRFGLEGGGHGLTLVRTEDW